jgi:glycosyltransferase involved in cell wall biosynthesis
VRVKICFVADGRSPIARSWMRYFTDRGDEIHLISLFPCDPVDVGCASVVIIPVGLSRRAMRPVGRREGLAPPRGARAIAVSACGRMTPAIRFWEHRLLAPLEIRCRAAQVRRIVERIGPDIVHAMRIPFEGMLAAQALTRVPVPLLVSVWGNDFTLWAERHAPQACMTRRVLQRADALHPDCQRDLHLARRLGFPASRPSVVLPGNGGVRLDVFYPGSVTAEFRRRWQIPEGAPVVLNPRGVRDYVRNDTLLRAVPRVLARRPETVFVGIGLQGNAVIDRMTRKLKIEQAVRWAPPVSQKEMAQFFRLASVVVSPSEHDGTPNTLIEAMASGALPVAGDIESVREWVDDGVNGLLCDPASPALLAASILRALGDEDLRSRAAGINQKLIAERAEYSSVMTRAEQFYADIIRRAREVPQQVALPPGTKSRARRRDLIEG